MSRWERDAVELLTEAVEHLESGIVAAQLAALQIDLGRHADARRSLERYAELSPLMEPAKACVSYLLRSLAL